MTHLLQNSKSLLNLVHRSKSGQKISENEVSAAEKKLSQYEKFLDLNFNEYIQQHHSSYDISLFNKTNITSQMSITPKSRIQPSDSLYQLGEMQEIQEEIAQPDFEKPTLKIPENIDFADEPEAHSPERETEKVVEQDFEAPDTERLDHFALDFEKIRKELKTSNEVPRICAILQALKWRITKVSGQKGRKQLL